MAAKSKDNTEIHVIASNHKNRCLWIQQKIWADLSYYQSKLKIPSCDHQSIEIWMHVCSHYKWASAMSLSHWAACQKKTNKLQLIKMSTDRSYICLMNWFGLFSSKCILPLLLILVFSICVIALSLWFSVLHLYFYLSFEGGKLAHKYQIENKSQTGPILNSPIIGKQSTSNSYA